MVVCSVSQPIKWADGFYAHPMIPDEYLPAREVFTDHHEPQRAVYEQPCMRYEALRSMCSLAKFEISKFRKLITSFEFQI